MKSIAFVVAAIIGTASVAVAIVQPATAAPTYLRTFSNVAVNGYDAVSYFEGSGVPRKGSSQFAVRHDGVIYHFATAANAAKFKANPRAFAPQFGGHCAWAMANGYLAPGDPKQYKLVGGKLYLNYDARVQSKWLKDVPGFIVKANAAWPEFVAKANS